MVISGHPHRSSWLAIDRKEHTKSTSISLSVILDFFVILL